MKRSYVSVLSLVIGFVLIFWSIVVGGGAISAFFHLPSIIITVVGSFSALVISYPVEQLKKVPSVLKKLVHSPEVDRQELIDQIVELARTARSQGLLTLDNEISTINNEFLAEGLKMVVDGMDTESIQEILELKISNMEDRHAIGQGIFMKWSELAPAFGMIGTLIGLINMLGSLTDPSTLGSGMAVALITTFYGSFLANLVFVPIATNLQTKTEVEVLINEMMLEGILGIQAGQNPRIIEQKLVSYLDGKTKKIRSADAQVNIQGEGQGYA
ncbi:motility protein A [Jeotgalibaca sp. PTS2502]|uniref:motility protein A n=1 Tax=Jeotgalibaca sp. PTS2502 TaxID=1903686 RepID=UPI0009739E32|nr:motility protein A [Jeotgalibaca sp. PTS2502]APZ49640.1 motility protein A [Jeotgalibaca sp. PTS2502]